MGLFSKIIAIIALLVSANASAISLDRYGFGYGLLNAGMFSESVTSSGEPSLYGSSTFHFLTGHINWKTDKYKYGLRIGYTAIPRESQDGAVKVTQLLISPQFGVPFGDGNSWEWNTSVGILRTESKGQGGSVALNNGTGSMVFYRPNNTQTSTLLNLETGLKYYFAQRWYFSGDLLFNGLLGERRNMSLFLTFGYSFGSSSKRAYTTPSTSTSSGSQDYSGAPVSQDYGGGSF